MRTRIVFAIAILAAGCAGGVHGTRTGAPKPETALVTCMVPGQIRQLDGKVTYLTASRPVTTTVRDCELRGGTPAS